MAGWVNGQPDIYTLSEDGRYLSHIDVRFAAIGTGYPWAVAAINTLFIAGHKFGQQAMEIILRGAISFAPNCGPPVECWRITREGIETAFKLESKIEAVEPASQSGTSSNAR